MAIGINNLEKKDTKRILILDDERRIREILRKLLTHEGYEVIEASTAVKAHEIMKMEDMDLILLDIKMPEVGGSVIYDVMGQFHSNVKVIVSSVYPLDVQKRVIQGAYDYYDKSQGINVLLEKIKLAFDYGQVE